MCKDYGNLVPKYLLDAYYYFLDEYEIEFLGINLLDYSDYKNKWFYHDYQKRLNELSNLIFGIYKPEIPLGEPSDVPLGFSNLVPMVLARV